MTTANHSDNPLPPPDIWTGPPSLDLATIIGKTGDLGIRAIAAMANVSEDEVRRALVCGGGPSESLRKSRDLADAKLRAVLRELGWEPEAESTVTPVAGAYKLATDLLTKHWVRRDNVERPNEGDASAPSTVTVHVLTSADIERLARLIYWLTTKMPWHDILGAIIDSAGVDMNSPGAEALARELVAELLRKNGADHGR